MDIRSKFIESETSRSELVTPIHEERLDEVIEYLLSSGARSALDLGCGEGALLNRLVECPQFEKIVGVDISHAALVKARDLLPKHCKDARVSLLHASFEESDPRLVGFDAAVLLETIEHIDPHRLSAVESAVFGCYAPRTVLITTPNSDYNILYGLGTGMRRHFDHRFEWGRSKFRSWASGVAERHNYQVSFTDIGEFDPVHGSPSQMAVFRQSPSNGSQPTADDSHHRD